MIPALITICLICLVAAAAAVFTVRLNRNFFATDFPKPGPESLKTADRRFEFGRGGVLDGAVWKEHGEKGIIVLAHGMGNTIAWYLPEILAFAGMGYEVFAFEYRGYSGRGIFNGFPHAVADLEAAIDYIADGKRPIILVGHSMGGYAVTAAAGGTHKPVAAVVAYAPFDRPDEAIAEASKSMRHPRLIAAALNTAQFFAFGGRSRLSAAAMLNRAGVPALIIHGSSDVEVTPCGCALYAHRDRVRTPGVTFRYVTEPAESSGHMTVVRRKDKRSEVNPDTFPAVAEFIESIAAKRE